MKKMLLCMGLLFSFCSLGFGQVDAVAVEAEVDSLIKASDAQKKAGKPQDALSIALDAKIKIEQYLGNQNSKYSSVLISIGICHLSMSNLVDAERNLTEAKKMLEIQSKHESRTYALCAKVLGTVYMYMGKVQDSESNYMICMDVSRKNGGKIDIEYAAGVINLGLLYMNMARYEESEILYLEAKEIFEKGLMKTKHSYYLNCLNNLGALYFLMGRKEEAEKYYIKVVELKKELLGADNPNYASSLANLAILDFLRKS